MMHLKLVFKFISTIWVIAISLWVLFTLFLILYGWPLDKSSLRFTEFKVHPVITSLSKSMFIEIASKELSSSLNESEIEKKFYNLSLLGHIKERSGYIGQATFNVGSADTAHYISTAIYDNAQVKIEVDLIKNKSSWELSNLQFIVPVNDKMKILQFSNENTANK